MQVCCVVRRAVRLSDVVIYSRPEHLGTSCTEYINNKITMEFHTVCTYRLYFPLFTHIHTHIYNNIQLFPSTILHACKKPQQYAYSQVLFQRS